MRTGAFAASLGFLTTGAAVAADKTVELNYEVYFGGMHILSAEAEMIAENEDSYRMASSARTQGLVDWMFEFRGEGATEGSADGITVQPVRHARSSTWDGGERAVKLAYMDGGKVDFDVNEDRDEDHSHKVTPLDPATLDDTMDPMSGIVMMSRKLQAGEACEGTLRLFDGQRRYDVTLSETEPKMIEPSKYSVFTGEAVGCHVEFERIGGFWKENNNKYSKTARDRVIWVAKPLEDGPPVPVQLTVQTGFGTLIAHLTRVRMGGTELALQQD